LIKFASLSRSLSFVRVIFSVAFRMKDAFDGISATASAVSALSLGFLGVARKLDLGKIKGI
jgi:hypothetical protein